MTDPAKLTRDLGGKWQRSYGSAPCPVCQPERRKDQNALTITSAGDKLLLNCKKTGCAFGDILVACGIQPGNLEIDLEAVERDRRERQEAEAKALRRARSLWSRGQPISGTHGETYLRSRGLTCDLPDSLRWAPDIYHGPTGRFVSAMLANVVDANGEPMGLHRTFFTKRGERLDKATGTASHKMMLGPCRGGAVRLCEAQGPLVVAEGIETALSLACGLLSGPASIWAALSTSGMRGLHLPPGGGKLTVAGDGEPAGGAAAQALAERAQALGWAVSLLPAPNGCDWNDVLMKKGVAA